MTASPTADVRAAGFAAFEHFDTAQALAMFGSVQSFRKILEMALDSLNTDLIKIEAALEVGDLKAASHLLHGIKGFAPIFCRDALCARVAELERSCKTDVVEQVLPNYAQLAPMLSKWRDEMAHYLTHGDLPSTP